MVKAWFNRLDFDMTADIQYTNNGKLVKPYLSSFSVKANVQYDGKYKEIEATVFPQSNKIVVEYVNDGGLEVAESPIEISEPSIEMDFNDLLNSLLDKLPAIKTIEDEIQEFSNSPDGELPKITQTVKIYGTIDNKNGKDVGKVNIDEYLNIGDAKYEVAHNSFEVQQSSDGELIAGGVEEFNPTYQEILDIVIPSQSEFEDLVELVKDVIRRGNAEFMQKNLI